MPSLSKPADLLNQVGQEAQNTGTDAFAERLARWARAHGESLRVAEELGQLVSDENPDSDQIERLVSKMGKCGSWLIARHYLMHDEIRVQAACSCREHKVCQLCALRRGAKALRVLHPRIMRHMQEHPDVLPYLVTLTVKDGPDLAERLRHLREAQGVMGERARARRNKGKGKNTEQAKAQGIFRTIEIKRGQGSGLWHPHSHAIWWCKEKPDKHVLAREWQDLTGDSHVVDVRPFNVENEDAILHGLCEVTAYITKFNEMSGADLWHLRQVTHGQRLMASMGSMRFTKEESEAIEKEWEDDPLDGPYLDYIYAWNESEYERVGYRGRSRADMSLDFDV